MLKVRTTSEKQEEMEEEEIDEGEVTRINDHSMKRLEDDLEVSIFLYSHSYKMQEILFMKIKINLYSESVIPLRLTWRGFLMDLPLVCPR